MRILLVDDDEPLMETLMASLIKQRYAVDIAIDGETAQEFVNLFAYDLIVLDMVLPDTNGITLCQQLRQKGITVPILMLTARDAREDTVSALDAGADDYVVKPFDFEVLCARIRALLRREGQSSSTDILWGELRLTPESFEVFYGTHKLHTTPKEYALLELFLRHPSRVFSPDAIIENLWSFEDPPSGDAVRTHIKGLRQKLKAGGAPKDFVETVYGMGYRLKALVPEAMAPPPSQTHHAPQPSQVNDASQPTPSPSITATKAQSRIQASPTRADLAAAVAQAWRKHEATMQERLRVLESTAVAIETGQLNQELKQAGCAQAHKLAGALGCFGFAEGSRVARELEHLLTLDAPITGKDSAHFSNLVRALQHNLAGDTDRSAGFNTAASDANEPLPPAYTPQLLLVDAAPAFIPPFSTQAQTIGLHCIAMDGDQLGVADFNQQSPDVVILWLEAQPDPRTGQALNQSLIQSRFKRGIERLKQLATLLKHDDNRSTVPPTLEAIALPILLVTDITDFSQRLQLVKNGVDRLLPTSLSPQDVLEQVQQMLRETHTHFRVVMVDDDDQVLDLAQTLVSALGIQLTTVNHPSKLWDALETVHPHMVILDVEMPDANGLELCQVVRADARWRSLPIVFLTIYEDISTQQQAFNLGADDFIHKSRMATELPQRILNRLRR